MNIKKFKSILPYFILFAGISILLYPSISDWWNSHTQSKAVANYEETVSNLDESEYETMFEQAYDYNDALSALSLPLVQAQSITGYDEALNVNNDGVIGYITINKIKQELPIYHGTSESVLNSSVGHLEGSSLPVGQIGTHTVLSAHRGLPNAKLFSDLDRLEVGDTFIIKVLNKTMTYRVDQIRIVLPSEIDDLKIDPNYDYCTLMTCTPYGINTHRLLVRGVRTENEREALYVKPDAFELSVLVLAPIIAGIILFVLFVMMIMDSHRRKRRRKLKL